MCDSVIVPVVIRASSRFLTQVAAALVISFIGVIVLSLWGTPDPWPLVLKEVAGLSGVMAGFLLVVFGAMWFWYGSCAVSLDTDQVVLSRWGRTRFQAAWADIDAVVFYTHVPKGFPRLEVIVKTDDRTTAGRHSGAIKATLPLLLTFPESDAAADTLLGECSRMESTPSTGRSMSAPGGSTTDCSTWSAGRGGSATEGPHRWQLPQQ